MMPAVRGKNLRSGDLAEQLGLVLLQHVALVAPVPRTEDVGVDAVVTLLRGFDGRRYIAEDSFFVQIKSSSSTSITFTREEVAWLYALELPFFVASVDRREARIALYCAHRLSNAFITNHDRQMLTIFLDDQKTGDELVGEDDPEVHIGPPILEWSLTSLTDDPSFAEHFYAVTKAHIVIARKTLGGRRAGWADYIVWKTNKLPRSVGFIMTRSRTSDENRAIAEDAMAPYFNVWLKELQTSGWDATAESLFSLLGKIRRRSKSGLFRFQRPPIPTTDVDSQS